MSMTLEQAWKVDSAEWDKSEPWAWIQWKGTYVCMGAHCKCGAHLHFDGGFAYSVRCNECGQVYACSQHIRLRPIAEPGEEFCRPLEVNSERRAVSNG